MCEALRLPLCKARSVGVGPGVRGSVLGGYERLHGHVGTRSLSYYEYRYNKSCVNSSVSHNISCSETKDTKYFSVSSRLRARIAANRAAAGAHHGLTEEASDGHITANRYISYIYNHEEVDNDEWDDDLDNNINYYNYSSISEVAGSDVSDLKTYSITIDNEVSDQVNTEKCQLKRDTHNDVTDITHKLQDVSLGNDKKKFWSDFYKNRQAKRTVGQDSTKGIENDINNSEYNTKDNYNNISKLKNAQFDLKDKNIATVTLGRDSIRPIVFNTKDRIDGSSVKEQIARKLSIEHKQINKVKLHASVNLTDKVVNIEKDGKLEKLRLDSEVSTNENIVKDSTELEDNVRRKPNIINKLTAYYKSKNREIDKNILRADTCDNCHYTDIPSEAESEHYFYSNSKNIQSDDILNIKVNKVNSKDKENYSDLNTRTLAVDTVLVNTSLSKSLSIDNDSASSKVVLHENIKAVQQDAHTSVKNSLLLRRLHIYEKISSNHK